jgi:hypothetical protein
MPNAEVVLALAALISLAIALHAITGFGASAILIGRRLFERVRPGAYRAAALALVAVGVVSSFATALLPT